MTRSNLHRSPSRNVSIEPLEIRIVPAITVSGGTTLKLVGDNAADDATVTDLGNGLARIQGNNGTQIILNGIASAQVDVALPQKLQITMREGGEIDVDDFDTLASLKYVSNGAGRLNATDSAINSAKATSNFGDHTTDFQGCTLGKVNILNRGDAGDDDAQIRGCQINGSLKVKMIGDGNEDDLIFVDNAGVDNQINGQVAFVFSSGEDKDLTIRDTNFAADVSVKSSAQDLQVRVDADTQFQRLEIDTGNGDDLVQFTGAPGSRVVIGELDVETKGGGDDVTFLETNLNGAARIVMGNANEDLRIDDTTFAGQVEIEATGSDADVFVEFNVAANVATVFQQKVVFRLDTDTQVQLGLNAAASQTNFQSDALFTSESPNAELIVAVARVNFAVAPVLENVIRIDV